MKNIVLIGMPGSGKSTVGVLLAKSAGKGFVDTDLLIQSTSGKLLYEMIEADGIEGFIKAEEEAICRLICHNCVIATGGSAVYGEKSMVHLKENGITVYLSVPCEDIKNRLHNISTRGVVMSKGETVESLFEKRRPLYEKYADITVDARSNAEEVVEGIIKAVGDLNASL